MWRQILSLAAILRDHLHRSGKTQDNVSLRIQNRFGQPKICLFQVQVQVIRVAVAAASWVHLITSTWMTIIRRQAQAYQSQQGQQLTVDQGYQVVGSIIVRVPPGTAQVTLNNRTEWVPTTAKYVRKNFPMAAQKTPLCVSELMPIHIPLSIQNEKFRWKKYHCKQKKYFVWYQTLRNCVCLNERIVVNITVRV